MKSTSRSFSGGNLPASIAAALTGTVPADLRLVAETFVDLQQARHEADYDLSRNFTRAEATDLIRRVRIAFQRWDNVQGQEAARVYLAFLLAGERLRRRAF